MIKVLLLISFFYLSSASANIPAGPEKLECGEYELFGKFKPRKISSTKFVFVVYPETKRAFNVTLTGFFAAEFNTLKNIPVSVLVRFSTKDNTEKYLGKILGLKGSTLFRLRGKKSMVKLLKPLTCI